MLLWVSSELPTVVDIPWYKELIFNNFFVTIISSEFEEFRLPSESFYGEYLLRPLLNIRIAEISIFKTWWMSFTFVSLLYFLSKKLLFFCLSKINKPKYSWIIGITLGLYSIIIGASISISIFACAVLLSGSRLEDQMAVAATKIPYVENLTFQPDLYIYPTSFFLAALIVFIRFIKGLEGTGWLFKLGALPSEKQKEISMNYEISPPLEYVMIVTSIAYDAVKSSANCNDSDLDTLGGNEMEEKPFSTLNGIYVQNNFKRSIAWGAVSFFFFPRALSLVILLIWSIPTFKVVVFLFYEMKKKYNESKKKK
jgi:hypothetical protein